MRTASLVALAAVMILTVSCATTEFQPFPVQATQSAGTENIEITAVYLNDQDLEDRYGERDNPFIAPPSIFRGKRYMVFELSIQTVHSPGVLRQSDLEFTFGNTTTGTFNRFHLGLEWQRKDNSAGLPHHRATARQRLIRSEVLPDRQELSPGETLTGLVVFSGRYPRYGEGRLTVPVYQPDRRPLDRSTLTWEF